MRAFGSVSHGSSTRSLGDIQSQTTQINEASVRSIESARVIEASVRGINGRFKAISEAVTQQETMTAENAEAQQVSTIALGTLRDTVEKIRLGANKNLTSKKSPRRHRRSDCRRSKKAIKAPGG